MSEDPQPIFPPEIEEIIFSLCAQNGVDENKNLTLVAKRVYQWLSPQLYEVAILHRAISAGRPKFSNDLMDKHGRHVRHLLFWDPTGFDASLQDPGTCISLCPNIVDLALWGSRVDFDSGTLLDQLLGLRQRLTRLSFGIDSFHSAVTQLPISTSISFISVTHLELIGLEITIKPDRIEEYFPSVTHLAFGEDKGLSANGILDCWKDQLKVLILYLDPDSDDAFNIPNDPRIAVILEDSAFLQEWDEATEDGSSSIWRRAEEMVKMRRQTGSS
ncbi:hypothetical protein BDN72DRAFT_857681 [Pluteus cervinus]|uniref:Uncharacterized protein n=1 Tax=Pluteus cervinus TaxID=181527 RepID=A0ACD3AW53_9AGAR|nr:hypothetical protein BDN72DRAFT_857681 [Pluteus cervinus]